MHVQLPLTQMRTSAEQSMGALQSVLPPPLPPPCVSPLQHASAKAEFMQSFQHGHLVMMQVQLPPPADAAATAAVHGRPTPCRQAPFYAASLHAPSLHGPTPSNAAPCAHAPSCPWYAVNPPFFPLLIRLPVISNQRSAALSPTDQMDWECCDYRLSAVWTCHAAACVTANRRLLLCPGLSNSQSCFNDCFNEGTYIRLQVMCPSHSCSGVSNL